MSAFDRARGRFPAIAQFAYFGSIGTKFGIGGFVPPQPNSRARVHSGLFRYCVLVPGFELYGGPHAGVRADDINVRFWHLADIGAASDNVRSWG